VYAELSGGRRVVPKDPPGEVRKGFTRLLLLFPTA